MTVDLTIRDMLPGEADALGEIYHDAVRNGAIALYSAEQVAAWSPAPPTDAGWATRLADADTIVAERDGAPVGFMTRRGGYIDLAFVAAAAMGQGVGDALYLVAETRARADGHGCMTTEASALARRLFERHGWRVKEREEILRYEVMIHRYRMEKRLDLPAEASL
ncbi:GNAT family N-acetyltransferase [Rhodophyticola porphyridii]|uniref:GNAT family N-acetyltransferase n=1 Tax=Rhodophyticola porphyridii TaxID=1852017 RepID=A0A3L9YB64_9RHOB|nr:GNAT family N-acetyltransferase [Rhodophyticola porphyridii]RMA43206.1 GNAT family N-acetyltransferase [Rhodophyticola porphyridii]